MPFTEGADVTNEERVIITALIVSMFFGFFASFIPSSLEIRARKAHEAVLIESFAERAAADSAEIARLKEERDRLWHERR